MNKTYNIASVCYLSIVHVSSVYFVTIATAVVYLST